MSFGFTPGNWVELKRALLNHPQNNPVTSQATNPFGRKFEVSCSLVTPDGRNPCIISVWIIEPPDPIRDSSPHTRTLEWDVCGREAQLWMPQGAAQPRPARVSVLGRYSQPIQPA